jgi:dihydroorotate dehydrogenase electron transfer subunit
MTTSSRPLRAAVKESSGVYSIEMPIDIEARVIGNTRLSKDYNVVSLAAPQIAELTLPGQFAMIKPGRGHDPLLRRPFSVFEILYTANAKIEGFSILSKRIGATTRMLYDLVEGDMVSCLGPLGQSFELVDPPAEAWMVAGGVGLAPFATLTSALRAHGTKKKLFYGARKGDELFYADWFDHPDLQLILATEDGSRGEKGRITVPLERELQQANLPPEGGSYRRDVRLYACGPEPMLEAVARLAAKYGRRCQVSVERTMGCGMGGCYSCVIPMRDARGEHHYVRSCLGGPVLEAADIVWE